jgi:hypothetical protein
VSTNTPDNPNTPDRTEVVPAPEKKAEATTPVATAPAATTRPAEETKPLQTAQPGPARPAPAQPAPVQPAPAPAPPAAEVVRGPYLAPVILGLVCLAVAAAAFAQEIADWSVDWGNVGPLGIVIAGAVLVVLGGLGLLSSRRRRR